MESTQVKKAFRDAEQEHEKDKIESLKKVIKATLEKLETLKKDRNEYLAKIDKKIDILKRDVDDFKGGRLDRISERQEKDKDAAEREDPMPSCLLPDENEEGEEEGVH